ncbi:MAG: hypothetical protein B5766_02695 [Candidatus Lumbricidophila eiseniae]|uniref:DivIVA domain-containing protein n=1 Tax=Candidatus Lumbricidiphila eiseniae TaxID=1969409 RepID=A0A2A6FTT4_9MICO|nr:MAG: hypothetical protein B5766_02695 [Candidatus Lumbricidophila eiseniae]
MTFPHAPKHRPGYKIAEVDAFLEVAHRAFDGTSRPTDVPVTSADIRRTAFGMSRKGYSTAHVDAALERLEDAFAQREHSLMLGRTAPGIDTSQLREAIFARLARSKGSRFARTGFIVRGYSVREVDRFMIRMARCLHNDTPCEVSEVRAIVFSTQLRGYCETQVDAFCDALVEVLLAQRLTEEEDAVSPQSTGEPRTHQQQPVSTPVTVDQPSRVEPMVVGQPPQVAPVLGQPPHLSPSS